MKNLIISTVSGLVIAASLNAQQLPLMNQYYLNPFHYNPAFTGKSDDVRAFLLHKNQWSDIPGSPVTSMLTVDGPIREKNIGLGMSVFSDVTDITERMGAYSSYSYRIVIDDDNSVFLGLSIGVLSNKIDFTKALVKDADDPFLLKSIERKTILDGSFGAGYTWKNLEIGVAIPQIAGSKMKYLSGEENSPYYQLTRHITGSAKYTIAIDEEKGMSAYPMIMVRAAKGAPFQYDINGVFDWEKFGWVGVSYRSDYAVGINLGVRLNNTLSAGYAYDLHLGTLAPYSGGSHEILLSYTFGRRSESVSEHVVTTTPEVTMPDAKTDSILYVLKKNDVQQKEEIEKLKSRIDSLSASGTLKKPSVAADSLGHDSKGFLKSGLSSDFKDESGKNVEVGRYIVIGSFQQKENAEKAKSKYTSLGYPETAIMFNPENKFYYVYISKPESQEKAMETLNKARETAPDSWLLTLL